MKCTLILVPFLFVHNLFGQKTFELNDSSKVIYYKIFSCISDSTLIDQDTLVLQRMEFVNDWVDQQRKNTCPDSNSIGFPSIEMIGSEGFKLIYKTQIFSWRKVFDPELKDSVFIKSSVSSGFYGTFNEMNDSNIIFKPEEGYTQKNTYDFLIKRFDKMIILINISENKIEKKEH